MLIPCNVHIVTAANDIRSLYAIYMCIDSNDTVQYVGVSPLPELLTLEDAYCNSMFAEVFAKPETVLELKVIALTSDEKEAYNEKRKLITQYHPQCNKRGYYVAPHNQHIMCNETGETWRTSADACRAHNIAASALSNHLNRKPGHKTVKGRTYSRFVPPR